MKLSKREEIMDRYYSVIAERNLYFDLRHESNHYEQLSKIAKLILSELTNGKHLKCIMFLGPNGYDYRYE